MYNPQIETFIRATDAGSFNKSAEEAVKTAHDNAGTACRKVFLPLKNSLF